MKLIDESIDTIKCFKNSTLYLLKCREVSYKSKDMMLRVMRMKILDNQEELKLNI